jgi:hypothetical protein
MTIIARKIGSVKQLLYVPRHGNNTSKADLQTRINAFKMTEILMGELVLLWNV